MHLVSVERIVYNTRSFVGQLHLRRPFTSGGSKHAPKHNTRPSAASMVRIESSNYVLQNTVTGGPADLFPSFDRARLTENNVYVLLAQNKSVACGVCACAYYMMQTQQ